MDCCGNYKLPEGYDPLSEPDPDFSSKYLFAFIVDRDSGGFFSSANTKAEKAEAHVADMLAKMKKAHLECFAYDAATGNEIVILVGVKYNCPSWGASLLAGTGINVADKPISSMHAYADVMNWPMRLDEKKAEKMMTDGQMLSFIAPRVFPPQDPAISKYRNFQYIHGPYFCRLHDELFTPTKPENADANFNEDPFNESTRIKLVYEMLREAEHTGGCNFDIKRMMEKGEIKAFFPLHNYALSERIWKEWSIGDNSDEKFDQIRDYFGEKIGIYFAFLSHMGHWLVIPGLIGTGMNIVVWYYANYSHPVLPVFAGIISCWSILMLEYFKRREKAIALRWGMTEMESVEQNRTAYKGEWRENFYKGELLPKDPEAEPEKTMKYALPMDQLKRGAAANTIVAVLIMMVIGVVAGIYVLRFYLENEGFGTYATTIASVLNAVQIQIFNVIYNFVSTKMVEFENHRTDSGFENSMISKLFVFQFVNSYSSFFFIAFVAQFLSRSSFYSTDPNNIESTYVGQCGWSDCMRPLAINLAILFGNRLVVTNFLNVFIPWYFNSDTKKKAFKTCGHLSFTPAEEQRNLLPDEAVLDSIARYSDVAIQYGYMVLFATALPIACAVSIIECICKARIDAWLMIRYKQRPMPMSASSMGTWYSIFKILSTVAVITNAGLICFTMTVFYDTASDEINADLSFMSRIWIFIGFQWVFFTLQSLIDGFVPDQSEAARIQLKRQAFVVSKLVLKVPDADSSASEELKDDSAIEKKHKYKSEIYPTKRDAQSDSNKSFEIEMACCSQPV